MNGEAVTQSEAPPVALTVPRASFLDRILWFEACLLLAIAHVLFAGYQLGVGNQSIQIPFLKHWANPELYARDPMVAATLKDYPSFFFRGLAALLKYYDLPSLYFVLHVATAAGVLLACYALAKALFKNSLAGMVAILILLAGHHHALGGDDMYSLGFTHTWAVFPLAIVAMVLLYCDWYWAAFALAGVIFNFHALTAAYLVFMFGFCALWDIRKLGWKRLFGLMLVFGVIASPTVLEMLRHRQTFDATWVMLTRIRSGDHTFPSTWWQTGSSDIPRYAMLIGLGALALSFPSPRQRKTLLLAAATAVLLAAGYVFAEIWPVATVMRAQLFRSSRLLLVPVFVHVAYSVVCGWRLARRTARPSPEVPSEGVNELSRWRGWLEFGNATVTLLCLAVPVLLPLLPWALVLSLAVALLNGRLSWMQAIVASAAMLIVLAAWRSIDFAIPGLHGGLSWDSLLHGWPQLGAFFWIALVCGVGIWIVSRLSLSVLLRGAILLEGAGVCVLLAMAVYRPIVKANLRSDPWVEIQNWARENTPEDAVFLTPIRPGGFRIHSERAVVCEWRDGTQAYFNAEFAKNWWENVKQLQRGIQFDVKGQTQLADGTPLANRRDDELLMLMRSAALRSDYVVLPTGRTHNLKAVYQNSAWSVYTPKTLFPEGILDKERWLEQDRFIEEVALPNIEKFRKSSVRVEVVDKDGRPIPGARFEAKQTKQLFGFGCSLPFFEPVDGQAPISDFKPPPVTQQELSRFKEVFNYSLIPFSGKWCYIEPEEGVRNYRELDKYVDWCVKNNIEIEFHFLSGLQPNWMRRKGSNEMSELFMKHAKDLVARYGDRIHNWQVINDRHLTSDAPAVIQELRRMRPDIRLGISDCTSFYSEGCAAIGGSDMYRGLDDVMWLKQQGTPLNFFSMHGHRPHGVWPDARQMYQSLDAFAKQGVKIHVTEFLVPLNQISGPVRSGTWTPQLQAEFIERFYTVLFSHPQVEAVNYWALGPDALREGSGLLDENYQPMPAFEKLKELIQKRWKTQASGQLSAEGAAAFRGFHGDYEMTVTLSSGKVVRGKFSIQPDAPNRLRLTVNEQKGTLE
jgi:hypothetical protein